jgi:hypothetical protein
MHPLQLLAWFFGGATLINAIPHLVSGLMGKPFQSPFANPPGEGLSSPTVNVAWGFFNLFCRGCCCVRSGLSICAYPSMPWRPGLAV